MTSKSTHQCLAQNSNSIVSGCGYITKTVVILCLRLGVRPLSVNTYSVWREIFVLSGGISLKLAATSTRHVSGHCWKGLRSEVKGQGQMHFFRLRDSHLVTVMVIMRVGIGSKVEVTAWRSYKMLWTQLLVKGNWTKTYANTYYMTNKNLRKMPKIILSSS